MPAKKILIYGILALLFSGCGQIVSEKLTVPNIATPQCPTGKKMVIMPFADYAADNDSLELSLKRNMAITEILTDELIGQGFRLPVQEDTLQYLADMKIITLAQSSTIKSPATKHLESELDGTWSGQMKAAISELIDKENQYLADKTKTTNALNNETIARIADDLGADYIMRGRIIKYDLETENTWRPLKRGLLPILFVGGNRAMFGVAKSDDYDTLGSMAVGYGAGYALGDSATTPYTTAEKVDPSGANSTVWGLAGAGVAYLAHQGGRANQAAVELRIWVQEPQSGEVIWTNRVQVKVKPETIFADTQPEKLFETAVNKAVTALVNDFVTKTGEIL